MTRLPAAKISASPTTIVGAANYILGLVVVVVWLIRAFSDTRRFRASLGSIRSFA
jgi:hypothetical protein